MCYHRTMARVILAALGLLIFVPAVHAADPLAEARRLYNAGRYDAAAAAAREAMGVEGSAGAARVVLGRVQLERFRQTADRADLTAAREALRGVDPKPLKYRERLELSIGQAEVLYLDDRFGAAAELFESSLDRSAVLGPAAHERVLDWWATALDRHAQLRPMEERPAIYVRIVDRMRGSGDLERAWQAAIAGWVRASLADDRGAALHADLDRLVTQAIIPERAAKLKAGDARQTAAGMQNEWTAFKEGWSK
jgi:hypothetical protein